MCNELGDRNNMIDYIEQYGNTVLCGAGGENCNEKELAFLQEMKDAGAESQHTTKMTLLTEAFKLGEGEEHEWAIRRLRILDKLKAATAVPAGGGESSDQKDEL